MIADFLFALLAANIAAGAAVLLVLLVRASVRRIAGARLALWLWLTPLAAGIAVLAPALPAGLSLAPPIRPAVEATLAAATDWAASQTSAAAAPAGVDVIDIPTLLFEAWALGALGFLALALLKQRLSVAKFGVLTSGTHNLVVASEAAGPAVIGVFRPRLVVPADFETRFSPRERDLVLAHERAHLAAGHTRINAGFALLTCLNWFNPLVHLGVRCARADQELACDAAVVERFPGERRVYGEALLKTQILAASLPLGCAWPSQSSNLLKERVMMLAKKPPGRLPRIAGVGLISSMVLGAGVSAWAVPPPAESPPSTRFIPAVSPVTPPASGAAQNAFGQSPASVTIICDAWMGRHSDDPKVNWREVGKNDAVVLSLDGPHGPSVSFPNAAFPDGVYPDASSEQTGMRLRTPGRLVYQAASKSMIDTITFDGLDQPTIRAVWQRFRIDGAGPRSIALQGDCRR